MSNTVTEVLNIFRNGWNKQVILYGPPGTSKTYSSTLIAASMLAKTEEERAEFAVNYKKAKEYLKDNKAYKLVQFHPSYSYEDFVRGITVKPKNGSVAYEVESKIIEKFCDENQGNTCVLVVDEINRAPLASVLGELIYGLEYRGDKVFTPYVVKERDFQGNETTKEKPLIIPENLYIIGTMNTADRSIGSMDYAVRRRFAFIPVGSVADAIEGSWANQELGKKARELYDALIASADGIFAEGLLEDPELDVNDIKIGHTYFLGKNDVEKDTMEYLEYRVKYQILPIYQEYIKDGLIKKDGIKTFYDILQKLSFEI